MEVKRKDDMEGEGVLSRGEARWLRSILRVYLHGVMIDLGEHLGRKQWGWAVKHYGGTGLVTVLGTKQ